MSHDEPDFDGWIERLRAARRCALIPRRSRSSPRKTRCARISATVPVLVVESLNVTATDVEAAPKLKVVQKFGVTLRNIEAAATPATA